MARDFRAVILRDEAYAGVRAIIDNRGADHAHQLANGGDVRTCDRPATDCPEAAAKLARLADERA